MVAGLYRVSDNACIPIEKPTWGEGRRGREMFIVVSLHMLES
jgi:hypothetical protein